jgi:ABC-type phosphate/phosphonate transport system permease subunit
LCANTINNNLNEQQQKVKNRWEIAELIVIVLAFIAWATWWYTQSH